MRVLLLPSIDGEVFNKILIPPASMSDEQIEVAAAEVIAEIQAQGDEWDWSDMEALFTTRGFSYPAVVEGPVWDQN